MASRRGFCPYDQTLPRGQRRRRYRIQCMKWLLTGGGEAHDLFHEYMKKIMVNGYLCMLTNLQFVPALRIGDLRPGHLRYRYGSLDRN